jgi:hypothetical protein
LLTAAYVLAIPIVFFGDPRFHYPAIPIVTVVAGAGIAAMREAQRARIAETPAWIRRTSAEAPGAAGG